MAGPNRHLRRLSARAGLAASFGLRRGLRGDAQALPAFRRVSPGEIAQRLRAEGYVLIGPLHRSDTVYLADVDGGPVGRERLVIDAWSGEILQRFVARPRYWRPGAGGAM